MPCFAPLQVIVKKKKKIQRKTFRSVKDEEIIE